MPADLRERTRYLWHVIRGHRTGRYRPPARIFTTYRCQTCKVPVTAGPGLISLMWIGSCWRWRRRD
jgi:hypothetical protein